MFSEWKNKLETVAMWVRSFRLKYEEGLGRFKIAERVKREEERW